jgi:hypothetical protein
MYGIWEMGHYAEVDYSLALCPLQSRLPTHLPWATLCQSRLYPPVRDFGFGLWFILLGRHKILTTVSNVVCVRKVQ